MHLIQGKLEGRDVPVALPQSLIPPSARSNGTGSFLAPAALPQEVRSNLLWEDTTLPSASPVFKSSAFIPPSVSPDKPQTAVQDPFGSAAFGVSREFNLLSGKLND
jgi:epidermal growth factor receptor substrate 15